MENSDTLYRIMYNLHRIAEALEKANNKPGLEERVSSLERLVGELSAGINCGGYHE